mmetsp:Transcript_89788/g.262472  ORF Transcript_89788/g.262472 Transcript_89788/m.262472 type:complete len:304 (+) Transcript_89788:326-1237(+)
MMMHPARHAKLQATANSTTNMLATPPSKSLRNVFPPRATGLGVALVVVEGHTSLGAVLLTTVITSYSGPARQSTPWPSQALSRLAGPAPAAALISSKVAGSGTAMDMFDVVRRATRTDNPEAGAPVTTACPVSPARDTVIASTVSSTMLALSTSMVLALLCVMTASTTGPAGSPLLLGVCLSGGMVTFTEETNTPLDVAMALCNDSMAVGPGRRKSTATVYLTEMAFTQDCPMPTPAATASLSLATRNDRTSLMGAAKATNVSRTWTTRSCFFWFTCCWISSAKVPKEIASRTEAHWLKVSFT